MKIPRWSCRAVLGSALLLLGGSFVQASPPHPELFQCNDESGILCAEAHENPGGSYYVGHDEPAVLFYSNVPGSGNNQVYRLRLPKDRRSSQWPQYLPSRAGRPEVAEAKCGGPVDEAGPREFRAPAQPSRHRREPQLGKHRRQRLTVHDLPWINLDH